MNASRTLAALALFAVQAAAQNIGTSRPGTQLTYTAQFTTHGYVDLGQAVQNSGKSANVSSRSEMQSSVSGTEVLTFLNPPGRGPVAAASIAKPVVQVQANGVQQARIQEMTAADLARTVYLYLDTDGRVDHIEFPKEYSAIARNLIGGLLSAQQFGAPPGGRYASSWQTKETSPQASYQARYVLQADQGGLRRVAKTISPAAGAGANAQRTSPNGKLDFTLDPASGVVKQVSGIIREDVFVQDRRSGANDTTIKLQLVSGTALTEAALRTARDAFQSTSPTLKTAAEAEAAESSEGRAAVEKQILGTDTAATLRQALPLVDLSGAGTGQRTSLYLKLRALFYLKPAEAAAFGDLAGDPNKASTSVITGALSTVGTDEAQAALCAVIEKHRTDAAAVAALLPELGSVPNPSEKLVAYLTEFSRTSSSGDGAAAAIMALGSASSKLAGPAPQRADRIVQELMLLWPLMKDRNTVLLALGNTQSPKAEKFILSQSKDASPVTRRTVATTLSVFRSAEAVDALLGYLKNDPDPSVRAAAAQSLTPRQAQAVVHDALLHAVQYDKMDTVRIAAMFAFAQSIAKDRQSRAVIARLGTSDASPAVRNQASQLLEQADSVAAK